MFKLAVFVPPVAMKVTKRPLPIIYSLFSTKSPFRVYLLSSMGTITDSISIF